MHAEALSQKFEDRSAVVGIIGLGYVGLPLALRFSMSQYKVIGFDIDQEKADLLNTGKSYIAQIAHDRVSKAKENHFSATTDFRRVRDCDALIICVPTPLTKNLEPDMRFVSNTIDQIRHHLKTGQIISLESTTYPGTTEELLAPALEGKNFVIGEEVFLVYSPEREDPGNQNFHTSNIPKVIGGHTSACLSVGLALYSKAIEKLVPVSSTKAAEMTKLLENIHRSVNIGLVNEMKIVADKMGIDIHEVIDAAATKPFGFTKFSPGPGIGGHCIPIDPFYLTWKAREYGVNTKFIELSGEINRYMPEWVVSKVTEALNDHGKAVKGSKILILGLAYKKNIDDARESPALKIMEILRFKGAELDYHDPLIPSFPKLRDHSFELKSIPLTQEVLRTFDTAILVTNHDNVDYATICENINCIIDCQNSLNHPNIIKA